MAGRLHWQNFDKDLPISGHYCPRLLKPGDRLVIDVGANRLLRLDRVILGLSLMEKSHDASSVSVSVSVESVGGERSDVNRLGYMEGAGQVTYRKHKPRKLRFMPGTNIYVTSHQEEEARQTCSLIAVDASTSGPLVGQLFAITVHWPNISKFSYWTDLALYHLDVFGSLLHVPSEVRQTNLERPAYIFDQQSALANRNIVSWTRNELHALDAQDLLPQSLCDLIFAMDAEMQEGEDDDEDVDAEEGEEEENEEVELEGEQDAPEDVET
eukprot:gnl/MRDRNA2_/MRDRNA2_124123_c0_seq1.p1 gnl/MRDRNA2_/MRDRNA2_124123_c0~~gnl/MRDRNA2_/MRDRNA2_124123_c0_seq1.p1  ORF type:complete len:313 (-),score=58.86 gnl/MRDRNA2_/MRDRNA2_124123_c0_seq1:194-1000(-)